MKRIAAMAALVITMLAVPAAGAMASTASPGAVSPGSGNPGPGSPGGGYGRPGPARLACPPGFRKARTRAYRLRHRHGKPVQVRIHGKPVQVRITCPFIPAKPAPKACRPALLRFEMAAGSSTLTEVSGPVLAPSQEFRYDGATYTIMTINPGADSFTVFRDGFLFVNKGTAITDGTGFMTCTR
jgi:hypothetical protein